MKLSDLLLLLGGVIVVGAALDSRSGPRYRDRDGFLKVNPVAISRWEGEDMSGTQHPGLLEFTKARLRARAEASGRTDEQIELFVKSRIVTLETMEPKVLADRLLKELDDKEFYRC
jgi:hypothetical protein